jgi:hypothetical protein
VRAILPENKEGATPAESKATSKSDGTLDYLILRILCIPPPPPHYKIEKGYFNILRSITRRIGFLRFRETTLIRVSAVRLAGIEDFSDYNHLAGTPVYFA